MRYIAAALLLTLAGVNGLLAWTIDTCTGNSADAAFAVIFTLPLNLMGMGLLLWRPMPTPLVLASIIPVPLALPYTAKTMQLTRGYLLEGRGVCDIVSAYGPWGPNGDEPFLLVTWWTAVAVFWLGLALAGWRAYRNVRREESVE